MSVQPRVIANEIQAKQCIPGVIGRTRRKKEVPDRATEKPYGKRKVIAKAGPSLNNPFRLNGQASYRPSLTDEYASKPGGGLVGRLEGDALLAEPILNLGLRASPEKSDEFAVSGKGASREIPKKKPVTKADHSGREYRFGGIAYGRARRHAHPEARARRGQAALLRRVRGRQHHAPAQGAARTRWRGADARASAVLVLPEAAGAA